MSDSEEADLTYSAGQVQQLLRCPVCLDRYNNPKILPCQHTLCKEPCLQGLIDHRSRQVKCPECRKEHIVPHGGAAAFPTNITIANFLDLQAQHAPRTETNERGAGSTLQCGICDTEAETVKCFHCNKMVCPSCKQSHTGQMKLDINRLVSQLRRGIPKLSDSISEVEQKSESLKQFSQQLKSDIREQIEKNIKELRDREKSLHADVDTYLLGELRSLRLHQENIEVDLATIASFCDSTESLLSNSELSTPEADMVNLRRQCGEYLQQIRDVEARNLPTTRVVRFLHQGQPLLNNITSFGEIRMYNSLSATETGLSRTTQRRSSNQEETSRRPSNQEETSRRRWEDLPRFDIENLNYSESALLDSARSRVTMTPEVTDQAWTSQRSDTHRAPYLGYVASPRARDTVPPLRDNRFPPSTNYLYHMARLNDLEQARLTRSRNNSSSIFGPSLYDTRYRSTEDHGGISIREGPDLNSNSATTENTTRHHSTNRNGRTMHGTQSSSATYTPVPVVRDPRPAEAYEIDIDGNIRVETMTQSSVHVPRREETNTGQTSQQSVQEDQTSTSAPQTSTPITAPQNTTPSTAPQNSTPSTAPQNSTPSTAPQNSTPATASENSTQSTAPQNSTPATAPQNSTPASAPQNSTPASAPQNSTPSTAPTNSTPATGPSVRRSVGRRNCVSSSNNRRSRIQRSQNNSQSSRGRGGPRDRNPRRRTQPSVESNTTGTSETQAGQQDSHDDDDDIVVGNSLAEGLERSRTFVQNEGPPLDVDQRPVVNDQAGEDGLSQEAETGLRLEQRVQLQSSRSLTHEPVNNYSQKSAVLRVIGNGRGNTPEKMNSPRGVAVTREDQIVVADSSNHRIQLFSLAGDLVRTFGSYGDCHGEFDCLSGVAVSSVGNIIISDRYNHRIQKFTVEGEFLRSFGVEGSRNGQFSYPWGVAVDRSGYIYVCDKENHRIQIFRPDGGFSRSFGSLGNEPGQLENPHYVTVTCDNNIVVSDTGNNRVQVFTSQGRLIRAFGVQGTGNGEFKSPKGVLVDSEGFILVVDGGNDRIQVFRADGRYMCQFGQGLLKEPEGIALTSQGIVVVADKDNHKIALF